MWLKKYLKKAADYCSGIFDHFPIKKKLYFLYLFCVIIPVAILDSAFFVNLVHSEMHKQESEMANIAQATKYNITKTVDDAVFITKDYYLNQKIYTFLSEKYQSPYDYLQNFQSLKENSIFDVSLIGRNALVKLYTNNDSIVGGSEFGNLNTVRNTSWYRYFQKSGRNMVVYPYLTNKKDDEYINGIKRSVCVMRKLDFYSGCEKLMKLNIDYNEVEDGILNAKYANPVYVCSGNTILYSNRGNTSPVADFETLSPQIRNKIGYKLPIELYTQNWDIYVLRQDSSVLIMLQGHIEAILLVLAFSVFVPFLFMYFFNGSFTQRLEELSCHLGSIDKIGDHLEVIHSVRGTDEIGDLMRDYNQMACRINELIQVVYKGKLKEQEADIARQNAELLALQSQINPHFLFNALESIRMRSILKHEEETAEMICKLSIMMRQSVDWSRDIVTVTEEMQFAEAYLQLQKYRFGEQLSYKISVAPDCRKLFIPKLTIVTFAENACVHGIEGKSGPGWVFLEVSRSGQEIILEVEDTGIGMAEEKRRALQESMEDASIQRLNAGGRVGVVNACFRLKAFSGGKAHFAVQSEEGVGCTVTIRLPASCAGRCSYPSAIEAETGTTEKKGEESQC